MPSPSPCCRSEHNLAGPGKRGSQADAFTHLPNPQKQLQDQCLKTSTKLSKKTQPEPFPSRENGWRKGTSALRALPSKSAVFPAWKKGMRTRGHKPVTSPRPGTSAGRSPAPTQRTHSRSSEPAQLCAAAGRLGADPRPLLRTPLAAGTHVSLRRERFLGTF